MNNNVDDIKKKTKGKERCELSRINKQMKSKFMNKINKKKHDKQMVLTKMKKKN